MKMYIARDSYGLWLFDSTPKKVIINGDKCCETTIGNRYDLDDTLFPEVTFENSPQEEKDLLLKDFCARLPYSVKCKVIKHDIDGEMLFIRNELDLTIDNVKELATNNMYEIKPYLFPLSSMNEEDIYQINGILGGDFEIDKYGITDLIRNRRTSLSYLELDALFSYFNKNCFDYRGLIPKGLALDATGLNIY